MKNKNLKNTILLSVTSGLLINSSLLATSESKSQNGSKNDTTPSSNLEDANKGNIGYHLMTEDELMLEMTDEGAKLYNSLTPEGKALARFVASQRCNGSNECKGLNACQTDTNKCAGEGKCKGTSKCAFSDKNLAVKVVAKKMAEKRSKLDVSEK